MRNDIDGTNPSHEQELHDALLQEDEMQEREERMAGLTNENLSANMTDTIDELLCDGFEDLDVIEYFNGLVMKKISAWKESLSDRALPDVYDNNGNLLSIGDHVTLLKQMQSACHLHVCEVVDFIFHKKDGDLRLDPKLLLRDTIFKEDDGTFKQHQPEIFHRYWKMCVTDGTKLPDSCEVISVVKIDFNPKYHTEKPEVNIV